MLSLIPTQIIDFHVHLFPDHLFDAIWKFFSKQYNWQIIHRKYSLQSIDYLKGKGVSRIIYSNYAHKKGVAKQLNEWNLRLLNRNENLYCFAAFHPDDEDCLKMAKSLLDHPRVVGFKLHHLVQNFYPTDERLFPLYETVIEKNKRILFHVGTGPVANEFVGYKNFLPLLRRYPQLPFNVAHLGGNEFELFFDLLQDHKNMMMDTAFCFLHDIELSFNLSSTYLEDNKDRLLYGSDFPNLIYPRSEEIETLANLKLSKVFYEKIFWGNGLRLLDAHCPKYD